MTADPRRDRPCPACGADADPGARFCAACGAPLSSVARADRRVITVLFADLMGFTQLSERLDAEEVQTFVSGCLDPMAEAVAAWGGYVDKFIGDCVMALFGAPVAYENEPERAVRAALDMHEAIENLRLPVVDRVTAGTGYRPLLRIGIATGPVVTGVFSGGGAHSYTAVGDAVNVASRIQGLCDPGAVLVDDATHRLTRHLFEFGDDHVVKVKGRVEPVRTHYVVALREERGRARGLEGRRAPMIGRGRELTALRERWSRAAAGETSIVLLLGSAGIGKSRLVEELIRTEDIEDHGHGRSYPYARRSPWEPVGELLRSMHGIDFDVPRAEAVDRIVGADEATLLRDSVGAALGMPIADTRVLSSLGPAERVGIMREALAHHLLGGSEPRLLVLDDLHWADHATLEFLECLVGAPREGHTLLLLLSRHSLSGEEGLARLIAACPDVMELEPLTETQSREMLDRLLEPHDVPDGLLDRISARSSGNPLFLEEFTRKLLEEGTLREESGVVRSLGDHHLVDIPSSVESLLSTRIDGLDAEAKRVLQYAAIVGRRFWAGVIADALARRPVDRELTTLEHGALVRPEPESAVEGDRQFVFEHLLMQEVAYGGLLRGLRTDLHGAVAEWLEERLGTATGEHDDWIAFHHERSQSPERAVPYLERAAETARDRGALADSAELLGRALDMTEDPEVQARVLCAAEELASLQGNLSERHRHIERIEELADRAGSAGIVAAARYRRARLALDGGDLSRARELGEEALELYRGVGDVSLEGDALRLLGRVEHLWGDYPLAEERYAAGLRCETEAGDEDGQADMYDRLGLVQVDRGHFVEALEHLDRARKLYAANGRRAQEARVLAHRATALRWLGDLDAAVDAARAARSLAEESGSRRATASAEVTLGIVGAAAGLPDAAERLERAARLGLRMGNRSLQARAWLAQSDVETDPGAAADAVGKVLKLCEGSGLVHLLVLALARKAELATAGGDLDAADEASLHAVELLRRHGNVQGSEERVYLARARVLEAMGRAEAAAALVDEAAHRVRSKAERIADPELRQRFLELPPHPDVLAAAGEPQREGAS